MQELLDGLNHRPWTITRDVAFVDTCFFIDELRHHKDEELGGKGLALLSFNALELIHVAKHLPEADKKHIRRFLKAHPHILVVDVPVQPGDWQSERAFVNHVEPELLRLIPDASDAVLLAAALARRCSVLTKDKHHLFTTTLENYVQGYGIRVFKEMKDYLAWKAG